MTSKNLFFKRMKKDLEQRIWIPVIFFILAFLSMEMNLISRIEIWSDRVDYVDRMNKYLMNTFFSHTGNGFYIFTCGVAVVSALTGFAFMHSSKKLDVYHSIPIKREKLFLQQYCYGIFYFLIPLLIHVLICLGICAGNGVAKGAVIGQAFGFLFVQMLLYLAVYSVAVFSVCLTGNFVISVLGCGVLLFYSLILELLKRDLMSTFFETFYSGGYKESIWAFSPIDLYINMVQESDGAEVLMYMEYLGYYGKFILMAVVYTILALILYKKRHTESAGKSMAFTFAEPVVKTMIVFPVSIYSGYLISSIAASSNDFGWFFFGCVFGFVICCPLMEIIFRKDVKAVLLHPLQIVFNGALVLIVVLILQFDVFGYDTYIPDEDKVESYAVVFTELNRIGYGEYETLEEMVIQDNDSLRRLLEHGAQLTRAARTNLTEEVGEDTHYTDMFVKYQLKNGKSVYRSYTINIANPQVLQCVADTYNDMQYKVSAYPVLSEETDKDYIGILLDYAYYSESIQLSKEKLQKFVETYQKELKELTFEELTTTYPVVRLAFAKAAPDSEYQSVVVESSSGVTLHSDGTTFEYYSTESGYRIYSSFDETLALLEEYGADIVSEIAAEDVISIMIEDYSLERYDDDGLLTKMIEVDYTSDEGEIEEIRQILPGLVPEHLTGNSMSYEGEEDNLNIRVYYSHDGKEMNEFCYFIKGKVPEFVKEDLQEVAEKIQ